MDAPQMAYGGVMKEVPIPFRLKKVLLSMGIHAPEMVEQVMTVEGTFIIHRAYERKLTVGQLNMLCAHPDFLFMYCYEAYVEFMFEVK